ncbi:MAG TPA: FecR domain-containing protein [Opitutaceae bacterium]|nr:FecR domain-containing protein [Opitutaceae bacterium]
MAASPDRPESSSEQSAAEWIVRKDRGLTSGEQEDFLAWQKMQPGAGEAWQRAETAWKAMDAARSDPALLAEAEKLEAKLKLRRRRPRLTSTLGLILAAAAALVIASLAGWRWGHGRVVTSYRVLASTAKVMALPDGSVATLNGDARLSLDFTVAERRVTLVSGEAHFDVVKNPHRPFLVRAGDLTVRAVGTAFNVRLDQNNIEVIVTEGRVRIEGLQSADPASPSTPQAQQPNSEGPEVGAGERVEVARQPSPETRTAAVQVAPLVQQEVELALAWQTTRLVFDETGLAAVVEAFNEHNLRKLELADERLGARSLTGVFRADNLDGFLRLLEASIGVRAETSDSGTIRLHPVH